jgi:tripartite-type tricarboxylate transporter receptor subunit TctC
MKRLYSLLLAALFAVTANAALAQDKFPTRPIRIIVAFGPGSATDVTARLLAEHMRPFLGGQNVIVENKPGAFGIVAIEEMARARPDGHTVMIGNVSTSALTPQLYRKRFTIDPDKDFVAISRVSVIPGFQMISPKHLPNVKTLADFIAYAKARPGQVRYSTTGVGAFTHYEAEVFSKRAGIEMVHIPVKEGPPAMVRDILGGDVHIASMTMSTAASLVASGQLKPLVTSMEQRLADYPDVPTMAESGFERVGTPNWSIMFVNAQTPKPVQQALFNAVNQALRTDALKAAYLKTTTYATPSNSIEEAQGWLRDEMARWKKIMEEVKIDVEQ